MTELDDLLRDLAPRVLAVVVRRFGDFSTAEDAVQEALITAVKTWPVRGQPDNPAGWLVSVASRRVIDEYRRTGARRRREDLAVSQSRISPAPVPAHDDTLALMMMCCHPCLTPGSAIPLTLRAVGGLSTKEIAAAFLVPHATMAQRISRAKARIRRSGVTFEVPAEKLGERVRSVLQVLYLLFNEGYVTTNGPELSRPDLSREAIRLTRTLHQSLPDDPEVTGLLALMLLTDARRGARTDADGAVIGLAHQDRRLWDRQTITEGLRLLTSALRQGRVGYYQLQGAIAGVHDQAPSYETTDWARINALYERLDTVAGSPMVTLNRAVAVGMLRGAKAGLELLEGLDDELGDHYRLAAVRAHLLERSGDPSAAALAYQRAADQTRNLRERDHLTLQVARLRTAASSDALEGSRRGCPWEVPGTPHDHTDLG